MDGGAAADSDGLLAPDSDRAAVLYSDRIEVLNLAGEAGNGSDVMMAIGSGRFPTRMTTADSDGVTVIDLAVVRTDVAVVAGGHTATTLGSTLGHTARTLGVFCSGVAGVVCRDMGRVEQPYPLVPRRVAAHTIPGEWLFWSWESEPWLGLEQRSSRQAPRLLPASQCAPHLGSRAGETSI